MKNLLKSYYSSSSSLSSESSESSESESEINNNEKNDKNKNNKIKNIEKINVDLPSAVDVLDKVSKKPKFLENKLSNIEIKEIKPIPVTNTKKDENQIIQENEIKLNEKEKNNTIEWMLENDSSKVTVGKRKLVSNETQQDNKGFKIKVSGKDKVKKQRLKGQSGIGSDFTAWKSETEMKLRQQFD